MRSFSHIASLLPLASPDRYGASCKIRRNQAPSAHASALPASIVPLAPAPTPRRPYCALRGPTVNRGHFHPVRTAAHLPPQLTHSMHLPYLPDLIPDLCPPVCLLTCPPYLPDMIPDLCPPVCLLTCPPVQCARGTFGATEGLGSQSECTNCSAGSYCEQGLRIACALSTYNPRRGAATLADCQRCPANSLTTSVASTSREDCLCSPSYYASATGECRRCPLGALCPNLGNVLSSLQIRPGFYRISNVSDDVQRCQDSAATLATLACEGRSAECPSASGCQGGGEHTSRCADGLTGPFCRLCVASGSYYSSASDTQPARCLDCAKVADIR